MLETIDITATDLRYILRAVDTVMATLEAVVNDGLEDESVLFELSQAHDVLVSYLSNKE